MRFPSETPTETGANSPPLEAAPTASPDPFFQRNAADKPVTILAWMMFLLPALGVPSQLMLQDTLKSAVAAFGVLIAALVFVWQQRNRTTPLLWHGLVWLPIALLVYALGSMAWSHTYLAGVEAIRWFILSLLLWLGLNTLTRDNLPQLAWGIHAGALVASLWVALQFWLNLDLFPQGAAPASTFVNRNFFAEYAVCALPFSVLLLATKRASRWLVLMALSTAFNIVAILMTGTRSALIALLVLCAVFTVTLLRYRRQFAFMHWGGARQTLVGLALVLGIGALGSVPSNNPKVTLENNGTSALERSFLRTASMAAPQEYTEGSFAIRSVMWKASARMILANPLTGVGAGSWEVQIPLYQNVATTLETDYYAHNEFLQLLSEYGLLVGGLVLAFLLAYLLHAASRTWQLRDDDIQEVPLRAFTLASLLALLIVSNAGFPWHLAGCGALLALGLAALANSDVRLGQQERFLATSLRWRPVYAQTMLALLTGSTLLGGYITFQAAQAERKLVEAILLANSLRQLPRADTPSWADRKSRFLQDVREGIAINPHYRKLTAELAEPLSADGDWGNAIWILESVAASRPHVTAIWTGLAMGYSYVGQPNRARQALLQVQRLKPDALATRTLEIILLSRAGDEDQAVRILTAQYDQGRFDYDMVQTGYAIGYKTHNWRLAIRSLELRNAKWPEQAADGYFRMGNIYADPSVRDEAKALTAFQLGLKAVPPEQKENFRQQVPERFRSQM